MTQFDHQASDLHAFSYGLDTPTKFLSDQFGSGLTPSLFGSLGGPRGFTPSMGADGASGHEYNPFEMSLGGSNGGDKTRRSSFSTLLDGSSESQAQTATTDFDLLSSNPVVPGRKRALSSPAITTPGGSTFPFLLSSTATQVPSGALPNLAINPSKRPRMSVVSSGSGLSDFRVPSAGHSDASPESSEVPTPPDSYLVNDGATKDTTGGGGNDIDVNGATGNIFSRLQQQQRQYLRATGQAALSQPQPLPLGPISNDRPAQTQNQIDVSSVAMPPLTRSASKKGKYPAQASPAPSSASASPAPQSKPKRAGAGRKKNSTQSKKQQQQDPEPVEDEADGDLSEDSLKRKQFLERNRIAACKSRQKKKEKVGKLEQDATDLCQKNQLLQAAALALRQEILTLRQIIQTHDGCSCEHAQGYLERDRDGRGIALLDNLAGRTMHLDYAVAPEMGSTDDVYSYLEDYARNGTVQEAFSHGIAPPPSHAMIPITNAPMPNLASVSSFAPSSSTVTGPASSKIHARRQSDTTLFQFSSSAAAAPSNHDGGIFTRSSAAQQQPRSQQAPAFSYDSIPSIQPQNHFGLTFDSNTSNQMSLAPVATVDPATQVLMGTVIPPPPPHLPRRQSSAPPTTPSWGGESSSNKAVQGGDYFSYSSANNA